MRRRLAILLALLCVAAPAREVKLAWNANPEPNIAGYNLHIGTTSGDYPRIITTERVTAYTVSGLDAGTTYYFAIAAINTDGLTSQLSAEISHTIAPETPPLDRSGWEVVGFSSQELARENGAAVNAIDAAGISTYWNSNWDALSPHYIAIRLPKPATVSSMSYLPWQGQIVDDAYIQNWSLQSSTDGVTWEDWAEGKWANTRDPKSELLPLREVRYIKLWGNERYASVSDLMLRGNYAPAPPASVKRTIQHSLDLKTWADIAVLPGPPPDKEFIRLKIETSALP